MDAIHPLAGPSHCPTCLKAYRDSADALERTHSLLLAALEATADGILVVDLQGRMVAHNTRFLDMWEIPADRMASGDDAELRGSIVDKLADPAAFAARVESLYADPEARSDDTIPLRDGRVFERFSHPQRLDGQVVGRVWSFRDATARVRGEEELRSRERQLAETQRLAGLGSWRWDVPENRVTWSDELYRIYGLDRDTFGATFEAYLSRVHPDDVAEVKAGLAGALQKGGRLEFEERIIRPDGTERVLRSMCEVTHDADGRPLRVVGACHDVTQLRRAADALAESETRLQVANEALEARVEERTAELARANVALREEIAERTRAQEERAAAFKTLQRSEEHFRTLIENGSDLIIVVDPDGKTSYLSPSAERLLGWTPEERLGSSSFEMLHPDDIPAALARRQEAIDNPGVPVPLEFRYRHRDGEWLTLEALVRTLLPDTAAGGLVVNARDVTSRQQAQRALAQAKDEAERAREAAERANRAKSEFLSRMSHELRTPMNSILGFSQLLAKRSVDAEQSRSIDYILKAGRHLLNLINEVLDISRIEANRQHLSLEPVRLDGAIHEALTLIRPLAAQNECEIEEPAALPDAFVFADRQRLTQVLLNLLSNAVKYNRPGGSLSVTVSAVAPADVPTAWRIAVRDTGPGIPADRMEELFVPFSRLGAEASEIEGTGLGLALSQRLVEAMGGTLEVESTVGAGSTFTVQLESAVDPLQHPRVSAAVASPRTTARQTRPAKLLYIEDNLANLTLVETILAGRPGITLITALQGRLGLELAGQHRPDLILLDLHLPDLPGDEVLARLRATDATRDTPVIVISADATPRRVQLLRAAGVFEYLTKPLDVDEFLDTVDAALDQQEA